MRVVAKRGAITAESESIEDAELLLSLRGGSRPKLGIVDRHNCEICPFIAKNETGLAVHLARAHKIYSSTKK